MAIQTREPLTEAQLQEQARALCLSFPEATEQAFGGHSHPTYRVRGRIFAMYLDDHHGDGRLALWCKAPPGAQQVLIAADPDRFFKPPYVGRMGWVGVRLDRAIDWDELAGLIADSYRMTAPKRLLKLLDGSNLV